MAAGGATFQLLAREVGAIFGGLRDRVDDRGVRTLFAEMGLAVPEAFAAQPAVNNAVRAAVDAADALVTQVTALAAAISAEDEAAMVAEAVAVASAVGDVVVSIDALGTAVETAPPGALDPAVVQNFGRELPGALLELLVVEYGELRVPAVTDALDFFGVVDREVVPGVDATRPPFVRKAMHLDRVGDLVTDPSGLLETLYGWGTPALDDQLMLETLERLAAGYDVPTLLLPATATDPPILDATIFAAQRVPGAPPGIEVELRVPISADLSPRPVNLQPGWNLDLTLGVATEAGVKVTLRPPEDVEVIPVGGPVSGELRAELTGSPVPPDDVFVLAGELGGSRLELAAASLRAGAALSSATGVDLEIGGDVTGLKVVVDLSDADGFLGQLLGAVGTLEVSADLGMAWSLQGGFRFSGSSALELELPVNLALGPVGIPSLYLGAALGTEALEVELSAGLTAELGPLTIAVDRMGVVGVFAFEDGNLGPVDFRIRFKPPTALGIAVDAGPIKGGGFLDFDHANERYEGILQLSFGDLFTATAIGLITTRMPDGSSGFSLLIIISAEFQPIQLGFGFTLNGVGGLLGLHRSVMVDALREGIKNDRVDDIMFPEDPIANAPRLLSDLRTIFPPRQDQFLVGPMAKLGWGTPTLITAELALIVELPDPVRIVILGVLKINLPDEDAAILRLQVNFLGILDFEAGELSFEANLYDSRLLTLTLSGGMAFRINWGDNPGFLMSVGGFHPAYDPPDTRLPDIDRLTMSLLPGNNPRLTLEAYFAVTSNTVQFGARIELYAGVSKFNVYGWLGFDALFQFDPFMFIVEVSAGLAVRIGSSPILSVSVKLTLKGPTPYNAVGRAKFKILFFTFKVKFNKTWGESRDTSLPAVEVLPLVLEAMADPGNWEPLLPANTVMLVTTRAVELPSTEVAVHPLGSVTVRQKVAPLGVTIEKFGSGEVAGDTRFDVKVTAAGEDLDSTKVRDEFAPAQFFDLSDSEKLSRASFEELQSGVTVGAPDDMEAGNVVPRLVAYEQIIIDARRRKLLALLALPLHRFRMFLRGGSMARSELAQAARPAGSELSPSKVTVHAHGYAVVGVEDLAPVDGAGPLTQTEAMQHLAELVAADPSLTDRLQVLPTFEVAGV